MPSLALSAKLRIFLREQATVTALAIVLIALAVTIYASGLYGWSRKRLSQRARELILAYGLPATFLVMVLAGTALPMASPLIVAFCSSAGLPPLPLALVAASGYTLGLSLNYALGYVLGLKFVRERVGRERFEKLSRWLGRWGLGLVAAFGLVPATPLETLSLICGAFHVSYPRFALTAFAAKLGQFLLFAFLGVELAWLIWD